MLVGNTFTVAGGPETVDDILSLLREEGIEPRANPDVYVRAYKQFGIEEAREIRERASLRALGARRVFVVSTPSMNREAQNALLKTLEEPSGDALFFFIIPSPETLLPTLRSRMQVLPQFSNSHELSTKKKANRVDPEHFLASSPQARLDMLKPLLAKGDDEKRNIGAVLSFLSGLESALEKDPQGLQAVYRARKYITDKGALVKPLLEQVALLTTKV